MPISPRLSGRLYPKIRDLVLSANRFLFFGTYSLSVDRGILDYIIRQKQNNPNLHAACLLPPPTDFILWDFSVRRTLLQAYQLAHSNPIDLARIMAENPQPAFTALDNLWNQSHARASRRNVLSHVGKIAELYSNGIISLLEPNMHAKFVACESNIYEGSGNLTQFGLRVNVEVYNFYPNMTKAPTVYRYAATSYLNFLASYLTNFTAWKAGSQYLTNANHLGTRVEQIANSIGIRFNPTVTQEKINILLKAREQLSISRSELWQLPGHKQILRLDFLLNAAKTMMRNAEAQMWRLKDKEINRDLAGMIEKDLEKTKLALKNVAYPLKELKTEEPKNMTWYEEEYLEKNLTEARKFQDYAATWLKSETER